MTAVFIVSHMADRDHDKLIGIYSTRDLAERAIERLRDKPGFRDFPEEDWWLVEDEIDTFVDYWEDGFEDDSP